MPFDATLVERHTEELAVIDRMIETLKDPKRWCKNTAFNGSAYCLHGALALVGCSSAAPLIINGKVWRAMHAETPPGFHRYSAFNDDPNTTHADIMAFLTRVRARFT